MPLYINITTLPLLREAALEDSSLKLVVLWSTNNNSFHLLDTSMTDPLQLTEGNSLIVRTFAVFSASSVSCGFGLQSNRCRE